jgi:nicotinamidase/pyrazinamidase
MNTLLVVVDTQYDFMMPLGALYVPGAEKLIVPMIERVLSHNPRDVLFTMDTHCELDYYLSAEAKEFPKHCIAGTKGHENVLPMLGADRIRKRVFDVWKDIRCISYLKDRAKDYDDIEIIGVAADYCVMYAYEGFIERGFKARVNGDLTVGIKENPFL